MEHKYSAVKFLADRMNTYPISVNNKRKEETQIETVLVNNNYPEYIYIRTTKENKTETKQITQKRDKWAMFTYIGKEMRTIAKLFRNTNTKIAYRMTNTIQNHLREKNQNNIYERSGIYQLKCGGCQKKYVEQTEKLSNKVQRAYPIYKNE
jgi:hypothetical protein